MASGQYTKLEDIVKENYEKPKYKSTLHLIIT